MAIDSTFIIPLFEECLQCSTWFIKEEVAEEKVRKLQDGFISPFISCAAPFWQGIVVVQQLQNEFSGHDSLIFTD